MRSNYNNPISSGPSVMHYIPHNVQEFDDDLRAIVIKHMGTGQGNPTQWVVNAVAEAFQRGVGIGMSMPYAQQAPEQRQQARQYADEVPRTAVILARSTSTAASPGDVIDVEVTERRGPLGELPYTPQN